MHSPLTRGDKVDYGIGFSGPPGYTDNPMPESTISPSQGLWIWLLVILTGAGGLTDSLLSVERKEAALLFHKQNSLCTTIPSPPPHQVKMYRDLKKSGNIRLKYFSFFRLLLWFFQSSFFVNLSALSIKQQNMQKEQKTSKIYFSIRMRSSRNLMRSWDLAEWSECQLTANANFEIATVLHGFDPSILRESGI